jgi:toxin-antitoxin system, toxin component, bro family
MSKSNLVGFYLFYFKVMQEKLKIFENPEFGQVRVIVQENNEPLFCLADICRILSIGNPSRLKERLEEEGVQLIDLQTLSNNEGVKTKQLGNTKSNFVNEPNLYRVIFQSRKEEAVKFQNWVFNEVLPSIRKTGSYSVRPMTHIQMLAAQAQAMAELEQRLNETENKVEQLVTIQEENLKQLNKLPLMQEEVPSFTPRQELNQMVRTYALSANLKYNEVWNKIYSELYYRYHISLNAYKKEKGENNLDIAEKIGAIDKLKIVVSNLLRELGTVKPLVKK